MTAAHYWQIFYGWCLGLGFVTVMVIIAAICGYFTSDSHKRRQAHKFEMDKLRAQIQFTRNGSDPDYVKYLEDKQSRGL
jgi:hypothetical protein